MFTIQVLNLSGHIFVFLFYFLDECSVDIPFRRMKREEYEERKFYDVYLVGGRKILQRGKNYYRWEIID